MVLNSVTGEEMVHDEQVEQSFNMNISSSSNRRGGYILWMRTAQSSEQQNCSIIYLDDHRSELFDLKTEYMKEKKEEAKWLKELRLREHKMMEEENALRKEELRLKIVYLKLKIEKLQD